MLGVMGRAGATYPLVAAAVEEILQVFKELDGEDPAELVSREVLQASSGHIVVHGVGREGLMMKALAMRLFHLGLKAHCVGDMTTPPIGPGDLLLASAGPGSFSTVDGLISTARAVGARVVVITAQPQGSAAQKADAVAVLPAQTMADDENSSGAKAGSNVLPMGGVYEGALFVLFEIVVLLTMEKLGENMKSMESRHTNLE